MKKFFTDLRYYLIVIFILSLVAVWEGEIALYYKIERQYSFWKYLGVQCLYAIGVFLFTTIIPFLIGLITRLITKDVRRSIRNTKISLIIFVLSFLIMRINAIVQVQQQAQEVAKQERVYKHRIIKEEQKKKEWDMVFRTRTDSIYNADGDFVPISASPWEFRTNKTRFYTGPISDWESYDYIDKLAICRNAMVISTGYYIKSSMSKEEMYNLTEELKYKTGELLICIEESVNNGYPGNHPARNLLFSCQKTID